MADYIDGSSSEQTGISRRGLIRKGMIAGGVGLWAVPVLAVVTRNGPSGGSTETQITPANHPGGVPVPATCQMVGSPNPGACFTYICGGTFVECVGNSPVGGPCFCDTDTVGACRCFADEPCANLANCPNVNAPNGGCPAGTFCVNPFSCCGVAKCARVCT